jgi:hypothetical protein
VFKLHCKDIEELKELEALSFHQQLTAADAALHDYVLLIVGLYYNFIILS